MKRVVRIALTLITVAAVAVSLSFAAEVRMLKLGILSKLNTT